MKILIIGILITAVLGGTFFFYVSHKQAANIQKQQSSKDSKSNEVSAFGKLNTTTSEGNSIKVDKLTVVYPKDWPKVDQDKVINSDLSFGVEVINDKTMMRLTAMSGINPDSNEKDLNDFLNDIATEGGKKIIMGSSAGATSAVILLPNAGFNQGHFKIITTYVNAPDNKSQYSVAIEAADTVEDKQIESVMNFITTNSYFEKN